VPGNPSAPYKNPHLAHCAPPPPHGGFLPVHRKKRGGEGEKEKLGERRAGGRPGRSPKPLRRWTNWSPPGLQARPPNGGRRAGAAAPLYVKKKRRGREGLHCCAAGPRRPPLLEAGGRRVQGSTDEAMESKDRAAQEPKLLKLKVAPRRTSASPIPSWSASVTVLHPPHRALYRCLVVASGALVSTTTPHHRVVDPTFESRLDRAL
jgi:hypothetical protein